jgi:hypothetical protein
VRTARLISLLLALSLVVGASKYPIESKISNFEKLYYIAPKFIANRYIISIISINLTSSCFLDTTVLDRPIKERRKFINIFFDEYPQEPVTAVCRLYNIDHDAIYKHRKRSRRYF